MWIDHYRTNSLALFGLMSSPSPDVMSRSGIYSNLEFPLVKLEIPYMNNLSVGKYSEDIFCSEHSANVAWTLEANPENSSNLS